MKLLKKSNKKLKKTDKFFNCYQKSWIDCKRPNCKFQGSPFTGECVENAFYHELTCPKRDESTCVGKCEWKGTKHKGQCIYPVKSTRQIIEYTKSMKNDVSRLKKYIGIMEERKNAIYGDIQQAKDSLRADIDDINKTLENLKVKMNISKSKAPFNRKIKELRAMKRNIIEQIEDLDYLLVEMDE